jgi:hypothetical protein
MISYRFLRASSRNSLAFISSIALSHSTSKSYFTYFGYRVPELTTAQWVVARLAAPLPVS